MHFVMAIGEKVIDSIEVDKEKAKDAEYIQALRIMLDNKHWLVVAAYQKEPYFYLRAASSIGKMN